MRKILAVIGRPGVGKTTLFKKIIDDTQGWVAKEPIKLVPTLYNEKLNCHILGKYEEGEIFAGTDRMSMAVQPAAVEFVSNCDSNILFEGDRLTNSKFFDFLFSLPNTEFKIIVLTADEKLLTERYLDRGSDQSETFLKGRKSKISNIQTNMDFLFITETYNNNNLNDQKIILEEINSFLF